MFVFIELRSVFSNDYYCNYYGIDAYDQWNWEGQGSWVNVEAIVKVKNDMGGPANNQNDRSKESKCFAELRNG